MLNNASPMIEKISHNRPLGFDMVAEFARPIFNRASQPCETNCVYAFSRFQEWVFHRAIWTSMGYLCGKLERATGTENDTDSDSDDVGVLAHTIPSEGNSLVLKLMSGLSLLTHKSCPTVVPYVSASFDDNGMLVGSSADAVSF
eukprot:3612158-Amphidinium_carterae.1